MRKPGRKIMSATVAAALGAGALIASAPASVTRTGDFSGRFAFKLAPPPCAALFCVRGFFAGPNGGPFDEIITSAKPVGPDRPGVVYGEGTIVTHTRRGNLTCDESFVFNLTPVGDKEGGVICTITGGTGRLVGASGHLELYGSQPAGSAPGSMGSGRYHLKLVLPK